MVGLLFIFEADEIVDLIDKFDFDFIITDGFLRVVVDDFFKGDDVMDGFFTVDDIVDGFFTVDDVVDGFFTIDDVMDGFFTVDDVMDGFFTVDDTTDGLLTVDVDTDFTVVDEAVLGLSLEFVVLFTLELGVFVICTDALGLTFVDIEELVDEDLVFESVVDDPCLPFLFSWLIVLKDFDLFVLIVVDEFTFTLALFVVTVAFDLTVEVIFDLTVEVAFGFNVEEAFDFMDGVTFEFIEVDEELVLVLGFTGLVVLLDLEFILEFTVILFEFVVVFVVLGIDFEALFFKLLDVFGTLVLDLFCILWLPNEEVLGLPLFGFVDESTVVFPLVTFGVLFRVVELFVFVLFAVVIFDLSIVLIFVSFKSFNDSCLFVAIY